MVNGISDGIGGDRLSCGTAGWVREEGGGQHYLMEVYLSLGFWGWFWSFSEGLVGEAAEGRGVAWGLAQKGPVRA